MNNAKQTKNQKNKQTLQQNSRVKLQIASMDRIGLQSLIIIKKKNSTYTVHFSKYALQCCAYKPRGN